MSELLFYQQPPVLNKEVHKAIRFSPVKDFRFTNKVNSVPLLASGWAITPRPSSVAIRLS